MKMTKRQQHWLLLGASLIMVVLMLSSLWLDLPLSQAVVNYQSYWGTVGQTIGSAPLYLVLAISGEIMLAVGLHESRRWLGLLELVGGLGLVSWQVKELVNETSSYGLRALANVRSGLPVGAPSQALNDGGRGTTSWELNLSWVLIVLLITLLTQWWLAHQSQARLHQLFWIAIFASLTVLLALAVNVGLKTIWGRYRPYEVFGHLQQFTRWDHINGPNGHRSFPSGHTMAATLAVVFSWFVTGKGHRWVWGLGVLYSVGIGISRIAIGAHFLSDVTASFFLTAVIIDGMWNCLEWQLNRIQPPSGR
ncbi:phosphatase PAP2 family protein [Fructilactobacillus myrtifloralis]|uniref:Phosphatase PAP2 family protein n=1 Tax=Fructilactobacillus myrtifloralis TaxID=2940301 RepID=A0ABY5BLZ6_9LACO|nr:phosphatase PAP2 family protein [Fructilactobacillus myrtifloralis]USS84704.1 phosphatase PAP2 family protein [Fructilactobacillus myrtifloralis]